MSVGLPASDSSVDECSVASHITGMTDHCAECEEDGAAWESGVIVQPVTSSNVQAEAYLIGVHTFAPNDDRQIHWEPLEAVSELYALPFTPLTRLGRWDVLRRGDNSFTPPTSPIRIGVY